MKMEKAEIEFVEFDSTDVITTSGGMDGIKDQAPESDYGEVTPIGGGAVNEPLQ